MRRIPLVVLVALVACGTEPTATALTNSDGTSFDGWNAPPPGRDSAPTPPGPPLPPPPPVDSTGIPRPPSLPNPPGPHPGTPPADTGVTPPTLPGPPTPPIPPVDSSGWLGRRP